MNAEGRAVTVIALVWDRMAQARLREALGSRDTLLFCRTVTELVAATADGTATAIRPFAPIFGPAAPPE
jgi:hypothetical protein